MHLLRDRRADLEALGVSPFGISRDSPWSHVAWREALDVDVPLLSDWNADAVRAFGVAQDYRGMNDAPVRSAFLVDGDGVVRWRRRYETSELPDMDEIVDAARQHLVFD
jgi:glutaredoxin-dependent peroxiredoxin